MKRIKEEVLSYIANNLLMGLDVGEIHDSDSFLELGIIDSTGVIELIAFLEERYGIHVHDEEIVPENLDSIASIERFVARKTRELNSSMFA